MGAVNANSGKRAMRKEARRFCREIFQRSAEPGEKLEVRWQVVGGPMQQEWFDTPDALSRRAFEIDDKFNANVWFGHGLRRGERGDDASVTRTQAVCSDVDFKCFEDDEVRTRTAIDGLPIPPTVIVHSGHGFQIWFLLKRSVVADEKWRSIIDGVHEALNGSAAQRLDNVSNPSRIMRFPGTTNRKAKPLPVGIVEADYDRAYTLKDFRTHGLVAKPPRVMEEVKQVQHADDAAPGPDAERIVAKLKELGSKTFRDLTTRISPLDAFGKQKYVSPSEADIALCALLSRWSRDPKVISEIVRQYPVRSNRRRKLWDKKRFANGESYGERTIRRALELTEDQEVLDSTSRDCPQ